MLCVYCSRELEAEQNLSADSEVDLFALHYVFMPLLRQEVEKFVESWNNHKLRTEHNLPHCSYSSLDCRTQNHRARYHLMMYVESD